MKIPPQNVWTDDKIFEARIENPRAGFVSHNAALDYLIKHHPRFENKWVVQVIYLPQHRAFLDKHLRLIRVGTHCAIDERESLESAAMFVQDFDDEASARAFFESFPTRTMQTLAVWPGAYLAPDVFTIDNKCERHPPREEVVAWCQARGWTLPVAADDWVYEE